MSKLSSPDNNFPEKEAQEDEVESSSSTSSSSAGEVVFRQYSLLRAISRHLNLRDLCSFARINTLCLEVSRVTLDTDPTRQRVHQTSWAVRDAKLLPETYNNPLMLLGPYGDYTGGRSEVHRAMRAHYREFLLSLKARPSCVLFLPSFQQEELNMDGKESSDEVGSFFMLDVEELGVEPSLPFVSMSYDSVVCTDPDTGIPFEIENTTQHLPAFSAVLFPERSDAYAIPFFFEESMRADQNRQLAAEFGNKAREKILELACQKHGHIPDDIKGVLILSESGGLSRSLLLLQEVGARTNKKVAVAGAAGYFVQSSEQGELGREKAARLAGFSNHNHHLDATAPRAFTTGLLFAGPGVRVSTMRLDPETADPRHLIRRLKQLREAVMPDGKPPDDAVAFMFPCCGRGINFHAKEDAESEAFALIFPGMRLVGLFGNGEIGWEHMDGVEGSNPAKSAKQGVFTKRELEHTYSTMFMVVSYKSSSS